MKTKEIAPGSVLQRMYLKERLRAMNQPSRRFLEVGAGTGYTSNILLNAGYSGVGFDLNTASCDVNREMNRTFVESGRYAVRNDDFLDLPLSEKFDLIISCMVIEHLSEADVEAYFKKCRELLAPDGSIITLVPAGMQFWGIEDEIAGHFKRYSFACFEKIAAQHRLSIQKNVGLTFPVSNLLLQLSNFLIRKSEAHKQQMSMQERTVLSSNRQVMFKSDFPAVFGLFLNEITMLPFHLLQKACSKSTKSMVIYCEMKTV